MNTKERTKEVPMIKRMKIKPHERGLLFREGDLVAVLRPGVHWYLDPLLKLRLQIVSPRDPWLVHKELDVILKSCQLACGAMVGELKDHQPGLVWVHGTIPRIRTPCP